MSNSDKVIGALENNFGKFDEGTYNNDLGRTFYSYHGNAYRRTPKAKEIIDKTLNMTGTDVGEDPSNEVYTIGSYSWETPTERIDMTGGKMLGKDTSSYLNIWITRK